MRRLESIRLSLLALVSLAGCAVDPTASLDRELSANKGRGGGGGGGGGGGAIASIQIAPANPRVLVGEQLQFVATAYDAEGKAVAATVTWTNSRPQSLGLNGRTGLATGKALDETVVVSATAGGISTSVIVPVRRLTSLSLEVPESALIVGDQMRVRSVLVDNMAEEWPDEPVTWAVDMPQLVLLTGVGAQRDLSFEQPGTLTLSVSARGFATQSVLDIAGWAMVSAYESTACAVTTRGEAMCLGDNSQGQLGNGTMGTAPSWTTLTPVGGSLTWSTLMTRWMGVCGLTSDAGLYCWGRNHDFNLGQGYSGAPVPSPQRVAESIGWQQVSKGCALATSGGMYCWGDNFNGALGQGYFGGLLPVPTQVQHVRPWTQMSAVDGARTCAVDTQNEGYCWGIIHRETAGPGTAEVVSIATATRIPGTQQWSMMAVSGNHSCGLTTGGDAYCWGENNRGQLGVSETCVLMPNGACVVGAPSLVTIHSGQWVWIKTGQDSTCGKLTTGEVKCWGFGPPMPQDMLPSGTTGVVAFVPALKPCTAGHLGRRRVLPELRGSVERSASTAATPPPASQRARRGRRARA